MKFVTDVRFDAVTGEIVTTSHEAVVNGNEITAHGDPQENRVFIGPTAVLAEIRTDEISGKLYVELTNTSWSNITDQIVLLTVSLDGKKCNFSFHCESGDKKYFAKGQTLLYALVLDQPDRATNVTLRQMILDSQVGTCCIIAAIGDRILSEVSDSLFRHKITAS